MMEQTREVTNVTQLTVKKKADGPGAVAHACNPSTLEGRGEAGGSQGQEIETRPANMVQPHLY